MSRRRDIPPKAQALLRRYYRGEVVQNPNWATLMSLKSRRLIGFKKGEYYITKLGRDKIHSLNDWKARRIRITRSRYSPHSPRAPQFDGWSFA